MKFNNLFLKIEFWQLESATFWQRNFFLERGVDAFNMKIYNMFIQGWKAKIEILLDRGNIL